LQEQRIERIAFSHPCDKAARHEEREIRSRGGIERVERELEQLRELANVTDRVSDRRLPRARRPDGVVDD
jgi:hypothetical protein